MKSIILLIMLLMLPVSVFAHSGGTDANGGHHCRTDCEDYGYEYGEYHYHDGGLDLSNYNSNNNNTTDNSDEGFGIGDFIWFGILGFMAFVYICSAFSKD
ncbi:YHYH domain-containing protein [Salibacterium salarium]|uniref:YHYH domain-containing protein n=1 Tax=Salibacterium salarium TaxID=284579 RepID=A0A3R9Q7H0_9BACI|nr:YHYH domain-containing protein [Salibacterium salarium]RSL35303.1 YHYH domain-containing protein [Salibacterium salarium]